MVKFGYFRHDVVNLLVDNLYDDLIVSKHAENTSKGPVGCDKYPKVAIELSDFVFRQNTLGHIAILG